MDYLLNIHTSTETAIVNICNGSTVLGTVINKDPKQHAAFLHVAIDDLLKNNNIEINQLSAVGVTNGPGSYTGIRVGLATAKGVCFALKIPLITFNTLEVMALTAIEKIQNKNAWYCPMIDARRMEVFTAVYDYDLEEKLPPQAMELSINSFETIINNKEIYLFGNGSLKMREIQDVSNFTFIECDEIETSVLAKISWESYQSSTFADIALSQPLYLKEFYFPQQK